MAQEEEDVTGNQLPESTGVHDALDLAPSRRAQSMREGGAQGNLCLVDVQTRLGSSAAHRPEECGDNFGLTWGFIQSSAFLGFMP